MENKLKILMQKEVSAVINKYNAAVFVLNGGSTTKALSEFKYNVSGKALVVFCRNANMEAYVQLRETKDNRSWFSEHFKEWHYNEVSLYTLRKNKHLFIGC